MFLSLSGISFYNHNEEIEAKYIARCLMSYGVPASGDLTTDKRLLKRIESGEMLLPVVSSQGTETKQYTGATEYSHNQYDEQLTRLESERSGAEQLGVLMKLQQGLI